MTVNIMEQSDQGSYEKNLVLSALFYQSMLLVLREKIISSVDLLSIDMVEDPLCHLPSNLIVLCQTSLSLRVKMFICP